MNQIILYKFGVSLFGLWHIYYIQWYLTLHDKLFKLYKFK